MRRKYIAFFLALSLLALNVGCGSKEAEAPANVSVESFEETVESNEETEVKEEKEAETNEEGFEEMRNASENVNLNQVGFLPKARKTVVVRGENLSMDYRLIDVKTDEEVYKGTLTGPVEAKEAEETVYQGDFTDFTTPGRYVVKISNDEESYPFTIGEDVYDDLLKDLFCRDALLRLCGVFAYPIYDQ